MVSYAKRKQTLAADALVLAAIAWLSAIPYVFKVGFYSDDWAFLWTSILGAAQGDTLERTIAGFPGRPLTAVYHALLFKTFGSNPLGHHLVNTAILTSAICLLYMLLVRLKLSRAESLASALILIALPQLSTVRLWIAASAVNLALLLTLASLHAQLYYDRTRKIGWAALAIVTAVLSLLTYEIFGPLLAAFPIALAVARHQATGKTLAKGPVWIGLAVVVLSAIAIALKTISSGRAGPINDPMHYFRIAWQLVNPNYDWRSDYGLNIFAAMEMHFWRPLADWARSGGGLVMGQFNSLAIAAAASAAVLSYWRLRTTGSGDTEGPAPARLLLLGSAAFVLGHAIFLIVPAVQFSPTGIGNRLLVAGAIGVAMIIVSVIAWGSNAIPPPYRSTCFSALVALVVFCGTLRVATVAGFWVGASQSQQRVLRAARVDLQAVPAGTTVILDGVCPYDGPAPVFETRWDVSGALSVAVGRWLAGDTVSPRMHVTSEGLQTSFYDEASAYPYGPRLVAYNPNLHLVVPLRNLADARHFFAQPGRWPAKCPLSNAGHGVLID